MEFKEAKSQFVQTWGTLGSEWGINRTMAQVHALLLVSPKPLTTEEVMNELSISRGNANMNLRELVSWDLLRKVIVPGDRKEYFEAEKDIWEIAKRVVRERKRREIEPARRMLDQLVKVDNPNNSEDINSFVGTVTELNSFVGKMDSTIDKMLKAEENWFFSTLLKAFK